MSNNTLITPLSSRANITFTLVDPRTSTITSLSNILPDGSIFKSGSESSTAISDAMTISQGPVFTLNTASGTNIHYFDGEYATIDANKDFHLLVKHFQRIRVSNTTKKQIIVYIMRFEETSRTDTGQIVTVKGKAHTSKRVTIHPNQSIYV